MLAGFDEPFRPFDRELGNASVTFNVAVVRTGNDLGLGM